MPERLSYEERSMRIGHNLIIVGWKSFEKVGASGSALESGNVRERIMRGGSKPDRTRCEFAR